MNQTAVMLSRARRGRGGAISYPTIQCNKEVDHHFILGWRPTGFFKNNEHQRCLKVVETSQKSPPTAILGGELFSLNTEEEADVPPPVSRSQLTTPEICLDQNIEKNVTFVLFH